MAFEAFISYSHYEIAETLYQRVRSINEQKQKP